MIKDLRNALSKVAVAETDVDIARCFECLKGLRPHLVENEFVGRVREMGKSGFRLAYIKEQDHVVAVAGYRNLQTLFSGDTVYVDDLVTDPAFRSRGFGGILIAWLHDLATEQGCKLLHLDSGVQRARAHKFYFESGFHVNCFHFAMPVNDH